MPASNQLSIPKTYAELRRAVEVAMIHGQEIVEQARVRTYHETGRIIGEHLHLHADEPNYGTKTMLRLAADLKVNDSVLYRCVRFVECFPILAARPKLTWVHYRLLIPVEDVAQRRALEREAVKQGWTANQLEEHIRPLRVVTDAGSSSSTTAEPGGSPPKLLTPKRGTSGICKVVEVGESLVADLGFASYLDLASDAGFKAGDFVQMDTAGRLTAAKDATKADLFTYTAEILKVVDGDTLWVKIYLRPRHWVKHKLRLRDLDAPEISTPEGKAAKRFVDSLLSAGAKVTVCTTKPDKYDRYLADVFVSKDGVDDVFLNNALLAAGHAVPKKAWEFSDWGET